MAGKHSARKDHAASHHGHKSFGKSGGGHGGLHSKMLSSPMSPKMPGADKALSGGKKGY